MLMNEVYFGRKRYIKNIKELFEILTDDDRLVN